MIEHGTDIEMNNTWSTVVQRKTYEIDVASWSSSTFKIGLPYYGVIKVTAMDGKPAPKTTIKICAKPQYRSTSKDNLDEENDDIDVERRFPIKRNPVNSEKQYCALRTTDLNGIAHFQLFPNELEINEYEIKVLNIISNCY